MFILPLVMLWSSLALSTTTANALREANLPLHPCPENCYGSPENWSVYSSLDHLKICEQPILLDFAIHAPLEDSGTTIKLRTCTLNDDLSHLNSSASNETEQSDLGSSIRFPVDESSVSLDFFTSKDNGSAFLKDLRNIIDLLRQQLTDSVHYETNFLIGYSKGAVVAVYSGAAIEKSKTLPNLVRVFEEHFDAMISPEPSKNMYLQLCGEGRNGDHILGVAINTVGNLSAVQETVQTWSQAACVNNAEEHSTKLHGIRIFEESAPDIQGIKPVDSVNVSSIHRLARGQTANSCRTAHGGRWRLVRLIGQEVQHS